VKQNLGHNANDIASGSADGDLRVAENLKGTAIHAVNNGSLFGAMRFDGTTHCCSRVCGFYLDESRCVWKGFQNFIERWNPVSLVAIRVRLSAVGSESRACVECAQLGESLVFDFTSAARRSLHVRIVHDHRNSVGGDPDIELYCICPRGNRLRKRLEGVLRSVRAVAAMADNWTGVEIKENVH